MAKFNLDFNKSNEDIIKDIDNQLKQVKQDFPKLHNGSLRRDYEKILETLPKVRELLTDGQRIPALSKMYEMLYSLES